MPKRLPGQSLNTARGAEGRYEHTFGQAKTTLLSRLLLYGLAKGCSYLPSAPLAGVNKSAGQ